MRILALMTDAFGGFGGIAEVNRALLRALSAHPRLNEVVVAPRCISEDYAGVPDRVDYIAGAANGRLAYILSVRKAVRAKADFSFILCCHINLLPVAFLARMYTRAPVVLMIHGVEAWKPSGRFFVDYFVKKISGLIAVSTVSKERFLKWTGIPEERLVTRLISPTIDTEKFQPGEKSAELLARFGLTGHRVLLTVGRLDAAERYKGIDEVLQILPTLLVDHPDLMYLIVGDGSDRARLAQKARDLGIAAQVVFAGRIPEEIKVDCYRSVDVYLMPGRGEGFGTVYLEAAACGIPVVGSKLDGSSYSLRGGKLGVLVDPDDPADLRRGIEQALAQPRGIVSEDLAFFDVSHFTERVHEAVGAFGDCAQ